MERDIQQDKENRRDKEKKNEGEMIVRDIKHHPAPHTLSRVVMITSIFLRCCCLVGLIFNMNWVMEVTCLFPSICSPWCLLLHQSSWMWQMLLRSVAFRDKASSAAREPNVFKALVFYCPTSLLLVTLIIIIRGDSCGFMASCLLWIYIWLLLLNGEGR